MTREEQRAARARVQEIQDAAFRAALADDLEAVRAAHTTLREMAAAAQADDTLEAMNADRMATIAAVGVGHMATIVAIELAGRHERARQARKARIEAFNESERNRRRTVAPTENNA